MKLGFLGELGKMGNWGKYKLSIWTCDTLGYNVIWIVEIELGHWKCENWIVYENVPNMPILPKLSNWTLYVEEHESLMCFDIGET